MHHPQTRLDVVIQCQTTPAAGAEFFDRRRIAVGVVAAESALILGAAVAVIALDRALSELYRIITV
jgi:hypothetical protein